MKHLKHFIFITREGSTYEPDNSDIENMQVIGFGKGEDTDAALRNMLDENSYLKDTSFDEVIAIELKNNKQTVLSLKML